MCSILVFPSVHTLLLPPDTPHHRTFYLPGAGDIAMCMPLGACWTATVLNSSFPHSHPHPLPVLPDQKTGFLCWELPCVTKAQREFALWPQLAVLPQAPILREWLGPGPSLRRLQSGPPHLPCSSLAPTRLCAFPSRAPSAHAYSQHKNPG